MMEKLPVVLSRSSVRLLIRDVVVYAYFLLLVYAACYKILDIPLFQRQLAKSPLIADFAVLFSYLIPGLEIIGAVLLLIHKMRFYGLLLVTLLMLSFTLYIAYILNFSPHVPCSCGGILATMDWADHLIFNGVFFLGGVWAIWIEREFFRMET